jgi:zinc protease
MRHGRFFLCAALALLLAMASFTAALAATSKISKLKPGDPIPTDPTVTVGRLDNGLRYYIKANRNPEHRAYLYLAVNAGSVLEDDDQLGLAHFVEHMGFNGTKHFPKQEIVKYLESLGFGFGCMGGLNAYTSFDNTVYTLMVPTDTLEAMVKGIQILEDWARWALLEDEEIAKERGVILEEWRLYQGPEMRLLEKELPVVFANSRYAERLPIGTRESIEKSTPEAIRRFYRDWYRPDLMAVIAVGDFDAKWIEKLVREHFASMPPAENPRPRTEYDIPHHGEMLFSVANDPEDTGTVISVYFKSDPASYKTVGDFRRKLIGRLHDDMFNRRLGDLARTNDSPILRAFTRTGHLGKSKDVYVMSAWVPENGVERALEALLTEVARVKYHGFTQAELDREKSLWLRIEDWGDQGTKLGSGYYIMQFFSNFLRGDPIVSPDDKRELNRRFIKGITLDDVNGVLTQWFDTSSRSLLASMPAKEGVLLSPEDTLRAIFARVEKREAAAAAVAVVPKTPLMAKRPAPGSIVSEKKIPEIGVTEWTLSNGVRVVLHPTDLDSNRVFFLGYSPGGSSLVSDADYRSVRSAFWIFEGCGAGDFDGPTLKKRLMGSIAFATPRLAELREEIDGKAYSKDVETMFQLLHLRFTAPRSCPDQYEVWQRMEREGLKNKTADPRWAFQDTVQMVMSQYHPRRRPMTEAMIDSIDFERGAKLIKERFADASDFTFVFYGDFEIDELKPLILSYIGSLPALHRKETWRDIGLRPPSGIVKRTVYRGIEPQCEVEIYFNAPYEWSRKGEYLCSAVGDILRERLRNEVREELGGTYSIFTGAYIDEFPWAHSEAVISFDCAPERADELIATVFAEIDSLKTFGPSEEAIANVKASNRRHLEQYMKWNSWWGRQLEDAYFRGEDPREILRDPEYAAAFDAADVRDAARRIFDMNNYALFMRLPEKKVAKGGE